MPLPQYNTEQLIANIKRRASVPTSQETFRESDFVALATDEMDNVVVPLIMSTREEYFVHSEDFTLEGNTPIAIPKNAIGLKLRAVCWVQSTSPLVLINIPRLSIEIIAGMNYGYSGNGVVGTSGFWIENNSIHLYQPAALPNGSTIRLYFFERPLVLVEPDKYAQVVSIDSMTNTVVLNGVPLTFEADMTVNTVSSTPGFETTCRTTDIVSIATPSIVLTDIEGIEVGDYISEIGTSAIPQIPIEAHSYLAQLTVVKCLEALGDHDGMASAEKKAEELRHGMLTLINPRVDGSVKKVVNPNGGIKTFSGSRWWGPW